MPPKTRGSKTTKILKENVGVTNKGKIKEPNNTKKQRKVLADRTNSASDDNVHSSPLNIVKSTELDETFSQKPRRTRKVPTRYLGNPVLVRLSKSNEQDSQNTTPVKTKAKEKLPARKVALQKLKTNSKILEDSLLKSHPKRVCRIPSKLEGQSVLSNKPIQPVCTSTPVANKTVKRTAKKINDSLKKTPSPLLDKDLSLVKQNKKKNSKNVAPADTNNNAKKQLQIDKCFEKQKLSAKTRKIPLNTSFRVFDDVKKSLKRTSTKIDPYEFTFDPDEEPPPQKKKKKRIAKPKQAKPKAAIKGVYEKNLAKALASLKNTITMKTQPARDMQVVSNPPAKTNNKDVNNKEVVIVKSPVNEKSIPCANNYNSVRIEDIAMDLQEPDHTIDYSPVNSPQHSVQDVAAKVPSNPKDPLNLRDELSFFDDQPVASSSMNASIRHPTASPWRVEFGSLPIKWPVNTYVKPNMTPAVESSFINNDSKKKHVYTNIVPVNDALPQETSLKQTSIISFIKEVAERSHKKKMKSTPVKSNSLFEDITNTSINISLTKSMSKNSSKESNSSRGDIIEGIENSIQKTPEKNSTKNGTFFGFDETEEENQENISPLKKDKKRLLRTRSKPVLQEINNLNGPSRAVIPVVLKSKPILNSDHLNNEFEDPKSGLEPPVFPETVHANVELTSLNEDDDSNSVHLFEDIDLIHHYHQPPRKSYGKAKKVMFRKNSASDSDVPEDVEQDSNEEDNLDDLSFKLPSAKPRVHKKKLTKKKKMTKKEEQEAENWAAGFNSMCEDIEEFDLVYE